MTEWFDGGEAPEWKTGFDDRSSKGLTCLVCFALVAPQPGSTQGHRDWHARHGD